MRVVQAFTFEAAHRLPFVPPTHKCYRMHGHSYRVEIELEGPVDENTGFVADFFDIERALASLDLDHRLLNDVPGLSNPTAENIAVWIWKRVKLDRLSKVRVYETSNCWAEYDGQKL